VHRLAIRVYYEDTDLAGIVYYANYLKFLERGRTEALRALDVDQTRLKRESGLVFVVTRLEIDYLAPARFDDLIEVTTAALELRRASVEMAQEVLRAGDPLCRARVGVACMDAGGRPRRLPEPVRMGLDRLRGCA